MEQYLLTRDVRHEKGMAKRTVLLPQSRQSELRRCYSEVDPRFPAASYQEVSLRRMASYTAFQ